MRILGHPLHPALVHFPIALLSLATLCDALAMGGIAGIWSPSWFLLAAGLTAAVPAMIAGLVDYGALPEPAVPSGLWHMALMAVAWMLYLISLLARSDGLAPQAAPDWLSVGSSVVGFTLLAVGGWFGGELVYRHGAGVRSRTNAEFW